MENKLFEAIEKNEVEKFLLGEGEYFLEGDESSGGREKHDIRRSFFRFKYSIDEKLISEEYAYEILDKAMINILTFSGDADNNSANNVFDLSMVLWVYFVDFFEEKEFATKWHFSDKLLSLLKERYSFHLFHNKNIDKELHHLMTVNNKLLKERFHFEIC
jgi:hypothetical protein